MRSISLSGICCRALLISSAVFASAPLCPGVTIFGYYYQAETNPTVTWQMTGGASVTTSLSPDNRAVNWAFNFPDLTRVYNCYEPNPACNGYRGTWVDFSGGALILNGDGNTMIIDNLVVANQAEAGLYLYGDVSYNGVTTRGVFLASARDGIGLFSPAVSAGLPDFYFGWILLAGYFEGFG